MPGRVGDDLLEVVDRTPLLLPGELGGADRAAQPPVAVGVAGEQEQVAALGIGHAVLRGGEAQRQLRAEDGADVQLGGGLGEPDHAVHAVVVGERERLQTQAGGLLDQLFGMARTVQEAEVGVAVQLGVRDARSRGGRGGGRWRRYGSRLRDQAGESPPSASGPPDRLEPVRPESAASSSDHGTSGLLHPMPGTLLEHTFESSVSSRSCPQAWPARSTRPSPGHLRRLPACAPSPCAPLRSGYWR